MEDEGIMMPIKTNISTMPSQRLIGQHPLMPTAYHPNPFVTFGNQAAMQYQQQYLGNQPFATPGFVANNFPTNSGSIVEPPTRKKSIIENINPFITEQSNQPADLLSSFPVSL